MSNHDDPVRPEVDGVEEPDLDAEDEAILDAIWDRLGRNIPEVDAPSSGDDDSTRG